MFKFIVVINVENSDGYVIAVTSQLVEYTYKDAAEQAIKCCRHNCQVVRLYDPHK
jgi:hypothetical protein